MPLPILTVTCDVCDAETVEYRTPHDPDCDRHPAGCSCANVTCPAHDWDTREAALFLSIVEALA